jgi:hypothetical protein
MLALETVETLQSLVDHANAHIEKGEQSTGKSEEHYIAAGKYIAQCKVRYKRESNLTWEEFCREHFKFTRRRAATLMGIADGRTSIWRVREDSRKRNKRFRETNRRLREREEKGTSATSPDDDCPECATPEEAERLGFLNAARISKANAYYHDLTDAVIDQEMVSAAQEAASAWTKRAAELTRRL